MHLWEKQHKNFSLHPTYQGLLDFEVRSTVMTPSRWCLWGFPVLKLLLSLLICKYFAGDVLILCTYPLSRQTFFVCVETALLTHVFKVCNLISFDICTQLWNHHHNQDNKPPSPLKVFSCLSTIFPSHSSCISPTLGKHWSTFHYYRISCIS